MNASLRRAKFCGLVTAVLAVKTSVALPTGRDALPGAACELSVRKAGTKGAFAFFLSFVLSTGAVLLSVAHPARRNTAVSLYTVELILSTGGLSKRRKAGRVGLAEEVVLVAPVHAVVLMVAHPGRHDAPLVVTLKPVGPLAILNRRRMAVVSGGCNGHSR